MLAGIILVLAGILLIVYPPLLSVVVAMFLILAGAMSITVGYYHRKQRRHFKNPAVDFYFRY